MTPTNNKLRLFFDDEDPDDTTLFDLLVNNGRFVITDENEIIFLGYQERYELPKLLPRVDNRSPLRRLSSGLRYCKRHLN